MSFYAVRTMPGRGIYTSWGACKEAIESCSKETQVNYKKFETRKEAKDFLRANCGNNKKPKYKYSLYVDGSYDKKSDLAGYGAILIDEKTKKVIDKISGVCEWEAKSWNIDGELTAAARGLKMALSHNIKAVNIYFDYEGIRSYAKGW